ncbi:carbonic anhydrase [Saccharopolyspora shandongensis]|uniref:carbonic anhydrase n=1 Tax=Saccharopolyspora shandongensis TaxID=418495 RepID=UPI0033FE6178
MQLSRSSFTRRNLLRLSGASTVAAVGMSACAPRQVPVTSTAPVELAGAETAWRQLLDGNARFVEGRATYPHQTADGRQSLVAKRHPFACVIACADSRVGPEAVSGGALGDLFVIRSAGEVLDDAVVGSVEYAVEHLRVLLVVVVGHAGCGEVKAVIDVVAGRGQVADGVSYPMRGIETAVRAVPQKTDPQQFFNARVSEQARRSAAQLIERSTILREATEQRRLAVRVAEYELSTGRLREISL